LELLHQLVPSATRIGVLINPTDPARAEAIMREMQMAARSLALEIHFLKASKDADLDAIFANFSELESRGLVISGKPFFNSRA
jgi:putative tryptophan/tyrosine transport system substrate-binding protein